MGKGKIRKTTLSIALIFTMCAGMVIPAFARDESGIKDASCDHAWEFSDSDYEIKSFDRDNGCIYESIKVSIYCSKCGSTVTFDTDQDDEASITHQIQQKAEIITDASGQTTSTDGTIDYDISIHNYDNINSDGLSWSDETNIPASAASHSYDKEDIVIISDSEEWSDDYLTNEPSFTAIWECRSGDAQKISNCITIETEPEYKAPTEDTNGYCTYTIGALFDDGYQTGLTYTYDIPATGSGEQEYTAEITSWDAGDKTDLTDDTFEGKLVSNDGGETITFHSGENSESGIIASKRTDDEINCLTESEITFSVTVLYNGEEYAADMGEFGHYSVDAPGHEFEYDDKGNMVGTWNWDLSDTDNPSCNSAYYECQRCGEQLPVTILGTPAEDTSASKDSTCEEDGYKVYVISGILYTGMDTQGVSDSQKLVFPAKGHNFSTDPENTKWSDDCSTCVLAIKCSRCDAIEYIDDTTITEVTEEPTCGEPGQIKYTAEGKFDDKTYSATTLVSLNALEHNWDYDHAEIDYDYENGTAIVYITCLNCGETVAIYADIEYEVEYVYNSETNQYEISDVIMSVKITGIDDSSMTYTFWTQEDAEETLGGHTWVRDALGSVPTCTVDGYAVYSCSDPGCSATMTETEKAYGHDWNMSLYSVANPNGVTHEWHSNYQTCTFNFTCNRCDANVSVESTVTSSTSNGVTTYNASCTFNGKTFQTSVTVNALGQTIDGDLGTTTVNGNNSENANNTDTTSGMLGDSTVGEKRANTAMAQTEDEPEEISGVIAEQTETAGAAAGSSGSDTNAGGSTTSALAGAGALPDAEGQTTVTETVHTAQTSETGDVRTSDTGTELMCAVILSAGAVSAIAIKAGRKGKKEEN